MADSEAKTKIAEGIQKFFKIDAPKDARMMTAKGLIPMPPAILVSVLSRLLKDTENDVAQAARSSLLGLPPGMLKGVLKEPIDPAALDFFGREKTEDALVELVLLNPESSDETFAHLAERVNEKIANIIAQNEVRLLRAPQIAEALKKNSQVLKSVVDRMVSFLRMNGVVLQGESVELTRDEINEIMSAPEPTGSPLASSDLVEELSPELEVPEEKKKSIFQLLQSMSVAQKVKMALRGNKETRSLLIKDSNKIVATSVVKNPRITEGEINTIAQMRTVHEEIIRTIAGNPEWTKHYALQVSLANNPKTAFPIALKFVRQLRVPDLQKASKNKNIAGQLSKIAKELYEKKRQ